jgi:fido (protein-threonine AMPylation protein)
LHIDLKDEKVDLCADTADTRPLHERMFGGLTGKGCEYFAGNFRGSRDCLIGYELSSPPGTTPSANVDAAMAEFAQKVRGDWEQFLASGGGDNIDDEDTFLRWLDVALERMVSFVTIHPYANGNGHISRFFVLCYLAAAGIFPESWPIDKRPPGPYTEAIVMYRNGYADELRELVLRHINGGVQ